MKYQKEIKKGVIQKNNLTNWTKQWILSYWMILNPII